MTVVVSVHDETRLAISSEFPMRDKELITQLPGAAYDTTHHAWYAPLTWASCRSLRGLFGDRLELDDSIIQWATAEREHRIDPALTLRAAWDADGDEDLYPFQRAGVRFLTYARRALLCDEMGTGKTVQTIRTLKKVHGGGTQNVFPAIVVAPNNMTYTWKREIEKWWPGVEAEVVHGSATARRKTLARKDLDVFIINYEAVRIHSRLQRYPGSPRLKRCIVCDPTLPNVPTNQQSRCENCPKELNKIDWKSVIVDEAHRLKNPKAKQTQAIWSLRTAATENIFALTGTAIANAPHDLWPALHLISREEWPVRTKYIDRYCATSFNPFGGLTVVGLREDTKAEFFDIVDPRMRRMPKKAVLPFLPDKTYSTRYVDMNPKQQKAYDQMEDGLIAMMDEGLAIAQNPLVQLTRLTQFASAYAEIDQETGNVVMANPSNKVDALMELLEDLPAEDPIVVMAQSRQLIELAHQALLKENIPHGMIVGGQSLEDREDEKTKFQAGQYRAILCTISAGGIGITLTRANKLVFLQRSWSMIDNAQAEDRVHRIGSEVHQSVEIIDIVSRGTLEERQRDVLAGKTERLEEIMRDKQTLRQVLGRAA